MSYIINKLDKLVNQFYWNFSSICLKIPKGYCTMKIAGANAMRRPRVKIRPYMESISNISNKIISFHRELFGESPTPLKLQKLCYYSQGYYLAINKGTALFTEDFQAWKHGPVVPELYQVYKDYGWKPINSDSVEVKLDTSINEHVEMIVAAYGKYDGAALSTMTHRESPWLDARKGLSDEENCTTTISKDSIQKFFDSLIAS